MIEISIIKKTKSAISAKFLQEKLTTFFTSHGVNDAECSVLVVNKSQMLGHVEKYLHETGPKAAAHPVLSFVQSETEGPFEFPPDNILHLGEIIVSADHAKDDNELYDLIEHGALHLLGIHHK